MNSSKVIRTMRYARIIATILALVVAASCAVDNVDSSVVSNPASSDQISVMGRITRFDDCEVDTRSSKDEEEAYVTSMALAVFPIEDGKIGNCIDYTYLSGDNLLFSIDRGDEKYVEYDNDDMFALYIFANVPGMPLKLPDAGLTLKELLEKSYSSNGILRPDDGFPMVGSLGDCVSRHGDGHEFKLNPKLVGGKKVLPTLDGEEKDLLNIPMEALFAKMSFSISVAADQSIKENDAPMFALSSYKVVNIPDGGKLLDGWNNEANVEANGIAEVSYSASAIGDSSINFSFYLPERLLEPNTASKDYEGYPFKDKDDGSIRKEDSVYMQRFKGNLLGDGQKATHIILKGKFRDHQKQYFDVEYTIYLGANSYDDFNIKRNTQYFNTVTIRGITASDDQVLNGNAVSIDHRVNVTRGLPIIINLRRETLLDSHFEVRPLRVRLPKGQDVPNGAKVTVTVGKVNDSDPEPDWVRIEHKNNDEGKTDIYLSSGKRRYFTTDLVSNELADRGKSQEASLSKDTQETFWVYVDQCDEGAPLSDPNQMRKAKITVAYTDSDNSTPEVANYIICQYKLFPVKTVRNAGTANESTFVYYIEHEEEYLYNYDAEDSYGKTKQEGMPWGLEGRQLSNEHQSFILNVNNSQWKEFYNQYRSDLTYDFYIGKHDTFVDASEIEVHNYAGQHFTKDIFDKSNGGVKILTMDEEPSGAVEYCYNRNKRKADGSIEEVKWYLPSADELEDIIIAGYGAFEEFQNNYYWISQPAYIRNFFYYINEEEKGKDGYVYVFDVYEDNTGWARATKVNDQFEPVLSGLNKKPKNFIDDTDGYGSDCEDRGCFYQMRHWRRYLYWWSWKWEYDPDRRNYEKFGGDEEFDLNGTRYHVHLGHLDEEGMHQDGYRERSESNRVRCVRSHDGINEPDENKK